MTYALTTTHGNLRKKFKHILTRQSKETYLILERSHIIDITNRLFSLSQGCTNTTHIINGEHRLLFEILTSPYQNITKQVAQFTLWTTSSHIVSSLTHNRTHNTVHLMLIRCYKDSCLSIRILIKSLIHQNTGTLHLCNLVLLSHARSRYTPSSQKKCSNN